jgi:hypothetical protein
MRRRSISHSYGFVGTSCAWICIRPRPGGTCNRTIAIDEYAMIAVQPMTANRLWCEPNRSAGAIKPEGERARILPTEQPAEVTVKFQPLDPGIVNAAIPAFFIGRNKEGFWVARDVSGQIGGLFLLENSALSFARKNSRSAGCATIFPSERIELDLENNGNSLVAPLGWLKRLATRGRQRMLASIGNMAAAVKRRLAD